jgi:hypothetical protein
LTTPVLLSTLSRQTLDLILDSTRLTMLSLLSRRMPDLIASMLSWGALLQYAIFYFLQPTYRFLALTGVAWLVVALDVVFVMMGLL